MSLRLVLIVVLLLGGMARVTAQGIVGAWSSQSGPAEGANVVVFLANGYYFHIQNASPSAAPAGVDGYEHGTYTWDAGTGAFAVTTLTDTNGGVGLSAVSGLAGIIVTIAGDTLSMGTTALSRVSGPSPIVGAWLEGTGTGFAGSESEVFAFFADGTYLGAQHSSSQAGIEHGTYVWDASTGAFRSSRTPSPPFVDTNGRNGISFISANPVAQVVNNGTRLVIGDDLVFISLLRVGAPYFPPATTTVVEYYHAGMGHYFITSLPGEITALDGGVIAGWARTGETFGVYAVNNALASNVCRFYSASFAPRASHFYTATECAAVMANPHWQFEGEVFAWRLPNIAGDCPAETVALYRLYNDGRNGAPNHRYTKRLDLRSAMLGQGFLAEGFGDLGVAGCAPT